MISDVVCEKIVEKKREKSENIKTAVILSAAAIVSLVCVYVILMHPAAAAIAALLIIGAVYLAVRMVRNLSVEYEYCFVNGELTVDKIINKSNRKNMMTLQVKNVDKAGYYDDSVISLGNVLNYSDSDEPENAVYFRFRDITGRVNVAIMNLDDEFITKMKPHFNQLVYREGFKK